MSNQFYNLFVRNGAFSIEIAAESLLQNWAFILPDAAPANSDIMVFDNVLGRFKFIPYAPPTGGTLSSVGLVTTTEASAVLTINNSPLTSDGNLSIDLDTQAANTFFGGPINGSAKPTFRTISDADLPEQISASRINGILSVSNIPGGTQSASFQLANGSGYRVANDTNGIQIQSPDGLSLGDIIARNIVLTGTVNQQNVTELNVEDQFINLLSGFVSGVPSLDTGINVRRGSQPSSSFIWSETTKKWTAGIDPNRNAVVREKTVAITNTALIGEQYAFNHALNASNVNLIVRDNNGVQVSLGVTHQDADNLVVSFARTGSFTGTWTLTAQAA